MIQRISMGSPEDRGFEQKTFNFHFARYFSPIFFALSQTYEIF